MNSMLPGLFLGGTMQPSEGAEGLPVVDPATGRETGAIRRNGAPGDRPRRPIGGAAVPRSGLAAPAVGRAGADADAAGRPDPRGTGRARPAGGVRRRQATLPGQGRHQQRRPATSNTMAGWVDKVLGSVIPVRWGALDLAVREPHGVCAQIVPWNFPLAMAARGIAPALAAGNCVVVKPAEDASLSLLRLGDLAIAAGAAARRSERRDRSGRGSGGRRSPPIRWSGTSPSPARWRPGDR